MQMVHPTELYARGLPEATRRLRWPNTVVISVPNILIDSKTHWRVVSCHITHNYRFLIFLDPQLHEMPSKKAVRVPRAWSLYPDFHSRVSQRLKEVDLHFRFYKKDDPQTCVKEWDTNIMGRFACHNQKCSSEGWSSKIIATTIRMYDDNRYNARVYFQRCKSCKRSSKPILDDSYVERVVYWLKKWNGVHVEKPEYTLREELDRRPHQSDLCEVRS